MVDCQMTVGKEYSIYAKRVGGESMLGGWIAEIFLWLFLTLPMIIIKIFKPKKYESKITKQAVCQSCGHSWKI